MSKKAPSYSPINALLRGLEILTEVGNIGMASVAELHRRTGVAKPTIVRNLETLEFAGYVCRDGVTGLYSLTARVLSLSAGYDHCRRLVELASPILRAFRERMPWPSDLALFDQDAMVILETNRDPGRLALNRSVGTRLSMTHSALGRAYLAFSSDEIRHTVLDGLSDRLCDDQGVLLAQLDQFRAQGFAENDQSLSTATRGIGVPIMVDGSVEACVNTIVLAEALSMEQVIERCAAPLQAVAEEISDALRADRTSPQAAHSEAI